ncbi:MAG: hypothetical protein KatS3mg015_2462 [Fimbriimonadales bacterium]|nr:MAG: hypothetical protein KatS3mg015_2462 [Fimbriimonadales bacterium]
MPDYLNIIVYLRAGDARMIRAAGHDPAAYVRALVREELDRRAETLRRGADGRFKGSDWVGEGPPTPEEWSA